MLDPSPTAAKLVGWFAATESSVPATTPASEPESLNTSSAVSANVVVGPSGEGIVAGLMSWVELLTDNATSRTPGSCRSVERSCESIRPRCRALASRALASKSTLATPSTMRTALTVRAVPVGMAETTVSFSQSAGPASTAFTSRVAVEALDGNQRRSGTSWVLLVSRK